MRFSSHSVHRRLSQIDAIGMPPAALFSPVLAYPNIILIHTGTFSDTHTTESANTTSSHDNWCENDWVSHASLKYAKQLVSGPRVQEDHGSHHTARNTDLLELCPLRRIAAKLYISMRGIYDGLVHVSASMYTLPVERLQALYADRKFAIVHVLWTSTCIRLSSRGHTVRRLASPPCLRALSFTCLRLSQAKHWPAERCHAASIGMRPSSEHRLPRRKSFVIQRLSRIAVIHRIILFQVASSQQQTAVNSVNYAM